MTSTSSPAPSATTTDASVGQRVGALLLDGLILAPFFVVAGVLFGSTDTSGAGAQVSLTGVPFLLTTLVSLSYFILLELLTGQTLGKKIVGIRVVRDGGGALGAGPAVVRNLLRLVDGFFFYLVGFIVALVSSKNQRVGDMAASTRVVKAR